MAVVSSRCFVYGVALKELFKTLGKEVEEVALLYQDPNASTRDAQSASGLTEAELI